MSLFGDANGPASIAPLWISAAAMTALAWIWPSVMESLLKGDDARAGWPVALDGAVSAGCRPVSFVRKVGSSASAAFRRIRRSQRRWGQMWGQVFPGRAHAYRGAVSFGVENILSTMKPALTRRAFFVRRSL